MVLAYRRNHETAERYLPATEAKVHFGELARDVEDTGEAVLVERNGRPVVVILSIDEYRRLQRKPATQDWRTALQASQAAFRPFKERGVPLDAAELIREGHEERDERVSGGLLRR